MSFLFCGLTMNAGPCCGRVHGQGGSPPVPRDQGHPHGRRYADYARCVAISTRGAIARCCSLSLLAIIVPVVVGLIFGVAGVMGLLVGSLLGLRAGGLHGQRGRCVDNRQEDDRGGTLRRQGLRQPQGYGRGRHGGRSVQGYVGSVAEHPHRLMSMVSDRHGGSDGCLAPLLTGGAGKRWPERMQRDGSCGERPVFFASGGWKVRENLLLRRLCRIFAAVKK